MKNILFLLLLSNLSYGFAIPTQDITHYMKENLAVTVVVTGFIAWQICKWQHKSHYKHKIKKKHSCIAEKNLTDVLYQNQELEILLQKQQLTINHLYNKLSRLHTPSNIIASQCSALIRESVSAIEASFQESISTNKELASAAQQLIQEDLSLEKQLEAQHSSLDQKLAKLRQDRKREKP